LLLIILVVVVLVVVLPIIFVAVPKEIRDQINNAELTIQGLSVTNTTSSSIRIGVNSTVSSSSSHSATIDAFNASFYLEDKEPHTPFLFTEMPEIHSKKVSAVNISQEVSITNEAAFADFVTWYLLNETFRVTVDGWTHVHVSGMPSTKVHFQKTVNLTGLNSFQGINVTSSEVALAADAQGNNFFGFVTIPNPSVMTVEIGNASFLAQLGGNTIGQAFIDDMTLVPGNNNLSLRANISQLPVIAAVSTPPACSTGILDFTFLGENITNNGQELSYLEEAFRDNILNLPIDVGADLKQLGLNIACGGL